MALQFYNTLTKKVDVFSAVQPQQTTIYSCGPTVYDHVHIGNLSAFIVADTLRRTLLAHGQVVKHVMNFTDVDDKTIRRSHELYPDEAPMAALKMLTTTYGDYFLDDMKAIGNDVEAFTFIKAAGDDTIEGMRQLITKLFQAGFAYIADDGVYFSIETYKKSGKVYGQLLEISDSNTSEERIANDEYDKESAHDFALWKKKKLGEPAWEFRLDGQVLDGRPGWHIECSVMSHIGLGQPFDFHTGGIDLIFPHHENEIAQSTALTGNPTYATYFIHNEHILVDGKKMSKSLGNFFTLKNLVEAGIDPIAFRLLVLQSHYRHQTNFSFENASSAAHRLRNWRNIAALRHQTHDTLINDDEKDTSDKTISLYATSQAIIEALSNDLDTPTALTIIDEAFSRLQGAKLNNIHQHALLQLLETIDETLGLQLIRSTPDITDAAKRLILERQQARDKQDFKTSDLLRDRLLEIGVVVRDTSSGSVWEYSA